MKVNLLVFLILGILFTISICSAETPVKFAMCSDIHDDLNRLDQFIDWANNEDDLDYVFIIGDIHEHGTIELLTTTKQQHLDNLIVPYYCIVGNHDQFVEPVNVSNPIYHVSSDDWASIFGYGTSHSVSSSGNMFIFLNITPAYSITPESLAYLEAILDNNTDKESIFVFIHNGQLVEPFVGGIQNDTFIGLISSHQNVKAVLSGHDHNVNTCRLYPTNDVYLCHDGHIGSWGTTNGFRVLEQNAEGDILTYYKSLSGDTLNMDMIYPVSGIAPTGIYMGDRLTNIISSNGVVTQAGRAANIHTDTKIRNANWYPSAGLLKVTILQWGSQYQWIESCDTSNTTTRHLIGGFEPNQNITLFIDGVQQSRLKSNYKGYVDFTYSGGYSEHEFSLVPGSAEIPQYITGAFSGCATQITSVIYQQTNITEVQPINLSSVTNIKVKANATYLESTPYNIPLTNLIGFWKFDDNLNDSSINNLNGNVFGTGLTYLEAKYNNGIHINNSTSIKINNHNIGKNDIFFGMWISPDDVTLTGTNLSGLHGILSYAKETAGAWDTSILNLELDLRENKNQLRLQCISNDTRGYTARVHDINTILAPNELVYISGYRNNTSVVLKINNEVAAITAGPSMLCNTDQPVWIGGRTYTFNGVIDNVLIYNRVPSEAEQAAIYYDMLQEIKFKSNTNNVYSSVVGNDEYVNLIYSVSDTNISSIISEVPETTVIGDETVYGYRKTVSPYEITVSFNATEDIEYVDSNTINYSICFTPEYNYTEGVIHIPISDVLSRAVSTCNVTSNDETATVSYSDGTLNVVTTNLSAFNTYNYTITTVFNGLYFGSDTVYTVDSDGTVHRDREITETDMLIPLVIVPSNESINITISKWTQSHKVWNESSENHSIAVTHVIGDFPANTDIQIKRDDINYETVTSNETGYIEWVYDGGFSEHTFSIECHDFNASLTSGAYPLTTQFTTSSDGIDAYYWDFENDGIIDSTKQNPAHTYGQTGDYSVNLTVHTSEGNFSIVKPDYITVAAPAFASDPVAWFNWVFSYLFGRF
ncbi:MAG: metallophosphoesterase [Candidatus Pacebacteria bacterium]|nr:metallophosphoesterase [Candidatus Paceibacterota bacterium]